MPENEFDWREIMSEKNKGLLRSVQSHHDYGMRTANDILGKPNYNYTEEDFTGDDWKDTNPIVKYNLAHGTSIFSMPQLRALQLAKQEKEFRENHPYLASIASHEETMGSPDFRSTLRGLYLAPNNNVRREIYKDSLTKNIAVPVLSAAGLGAFGSMPAFAAQSIWAYDSMKDLTSENGIKKTFDLVNKGQYRDALKSGAGDAFNIAIVTTPFKTLGKSISAIRAAKPAMEVTRAVRPVGLLDNAEWQPQIWDTALPEYSRPKIILSKYKSGGILKAQGGKIKSIF